MTLDKEVHILNLFLSTAGPLSYVYSLQVKLMWGSKWGTARVLFCLTRYLPFIASVIYQYCASTCLFEVNSSSTLTFDVADAFAHFPDPSDYVRLCLISIMYEADIEGRMNVSHCMTL